jgi:hypothetical protein
MPRSSVLLAVAALALAAPRPAAAFTFVDLGETGGMPEGSLWAVEVGAGDVGSSFEIEWGVDDPALSAVATFTLLGFDADGAVFDIELDHTTDLADSDLENAAILSMGFGVDPDVVATLVSAGSVFDMVSAGTGPQQTYPGEFHQIDVCIFAEGCSGGAIDAGLAAGESDSLRIALEPTDGSFGETFTLAFFPIKFQTSAGSFEPAGAPPIPEPTSMLLYAGGVAVAGAGARRRRRG